MPIVKSNKIRNCKKSPKLEKVIEPSISEKDYEESLNIIGDLHHLADEQGKKFKHQLNLHQSLIKVLEEENKKKDQAILEKDKLIDDSLKKISDLDNRITQMATKPVEKKKYL
jgi:hypothetical protein